MVRSAIKSSSRKGRSTMDQLPVEVIGNILSHLKEAQDIVLASATCRKWREAWTNHVHTLSFDYEKSRIYSELTTRDIEILMTETIFQTNGLRSLSILMNDVGGFSDLAVVGWLLYTRKTLRELHFSPRSLQTNILEKCGIRKLEVLSLSNICIEPTYQKLSFLKSLSLYSIRSSALHLNLVLAACPKIELLDLVEPVIMDKWLKLSSVSLKSISVASLVIENFILEVDNLEKFQLEDCTLEFFQLIGKGSLKILKMDNGADGSIDSVDIDEDTKNLEVINICNFSIKSKLYSMIERSSKLKKLRLWNVGFYDGRQDHITICSPQLSDLSSNNDFVIDDFLRRSRLENVKALELGGDVKGGLLRLVGRFLDKCPNMKKLVICVVFPVPNAQEDYNCFASFTSSVFQLTRRYTQLQVSFEFGRVANFDPRKCTPRENDSS